MYIFAIIYFIILLSVFVLIFSFAIVSSPNYNIAYKLLLKVFKAQQFSNVRNVNTVHGLSIIRADANGENYLFGLKINNSVINVNDVTTLYEISQEQHIHTVVIATLSPISNVTAAYRKIKEYNIDVWDKRKLTDLSYNFNFSSLENSQNSSILRTSDTSDDTCEIDTSSFDPIQEDFPETHSIFSGLFDRPDHL